MQVKSSQQTGLARYNKEGLAKSAGKDFRDGAVVPFESC
jgi:hypothetical protein